MRVRTFARRFPSNMPLTQLTPFLEKITAGCNGWIRIGDPLTPSPLLAVFHRFAANANACHDADKHWQFSRFRCFTFVQQNPSYPTILLPRCYPEKRQSKGHGHGQSQGFSSTRV
jgi:hypothetical protein